MRLTTTLHNCAKLLKIESKSASLKIAFSYTLKIHFLPKLIFWKLTMANALHVTLKNINMLERKWTVCSADGLIFYLGKTSGAKGCETMILKLLEKRQKKRKNRESENRYRLEIIQVLIDISFVRKMKKKFKSSISIRCNLRIFPGLWKKM